MRFSAFKIEKPPVGSSLFVLSYTVNFKRFYLHTVYSFLLYVVLLIKCFAHQQAYPDKIQQGLKLKYQKHGSEYLMVCPQLGTILSFEYILHL